MWVHPIPFLASSREVGRMQMQACGYSEIVQCVFGVKYAGMQLFHSEEVTISFKTLSKLFAGIF